MKVKHWFRYDKLLHPVELFKGLSRILLSYIARYHINLLEKWRDNFKKARCNFTIDRVKWEENTQLFLYTSTDLYSCVFGNGKYEEHEINFLKSVLKEGDIFIDIGANVGLYTVVASKRVGQTGSVFAFEPSTREYELLQKNITLNKLNNVKLLKIALSNYNGIASLRVAGGKNTGMNTLAPTFFSDRVKLQNTEKVPIYKLDDYLDKLSINTITGIKMDIEGYEIFALEGMKNTLQRFMPFLMMEVNERALQTTGNNSKKLLGLVKNLDYEIFYYDENGYLIQTPPSFISMPHPEIVSYNIVYSQKFRKMEERLFLYLV